MSKKTNSHDNKVKSWREILSRQKASGQSVSQFCLEQKINFHTFCYWRNKFAKSQGRFLIIAKPELRPSFAKIHLPNGVTIELGSSLESVETQGFIKSLCGVGQQPKDGCRAKS